MMKRLTATAAAVCFLPFACSSNAPEPTQGAEDGVPILDGAAPGDDFTGSGDDPSSSGGGQGGSGGEGSGGSQSCSAPDDAASCVGEIYAGESIPLDIYIMFDQSGSMCSCIDAGASQICPNPECTQTRLDAVRQA